MKKFLVLLSTLALFGFTLGTASAQSVPACDSSTFDTFATGTVNTQNGWYVSGPFDQEVVPNTFGVPSFGCKSLRISNATTSVFIYNQVFSGPSNAEAGEASALNSNGDTGTTNNRFEAQFDLASVTQAEQPGMHLSVSPDRGDGTRMSSLGFEDTASGINVYFDEFTGTTSPVNFNETQIATNLSRAQPHTFKYLMDFVEGASNDIVKIFIDGSLVHTGTSWENYYRFDSGAFGGPTATSSRTVGHLVFYELNPASPSNEFGGYLIDNVSLLSTTTPASSTSTPTTTPPVITLNGSSTMNIFVGTSFTDPGATAVSGTTTVPVTATGTVDTSTAGNYTILYTATSSSDEVATTTRVVNVFATSTAPTITLNGSSTMNLTAGATFTDPGATAIDAIGNSLTVTATGTVNTSAVGTYNLVYSATDQNSNTATTSRTVNVAAAPVVTPPATTGGGGGGGVPDSAYIPGRPGFIYAPLPGYSPIVSTNPSTGGSPINVAIVSTPTGQVLGVAVYNFKRNMKMGSTGDDVQELQKYLISQGYLVLKNPTKYFGILTAKALAKWQKKNNLPATGYFGPMSRAAIVK